jgi:hypothetical protein
MIICYADGAVEDEKRVLSECTLNNSIRERFAAVCKLMQQQVVHAFMCPRLLPITKCMLGHLQDLEACHLLYTICV